MNQNTSRLRLGEGEGEEKNDERPVEDAVELALQLLQMTPVLMV